MKAECKISGCPVSATIQKIDNSEFMNINFRGDIVHPVEEYKSRRRIDDEKKALDSVLVAHPNTRPSSTFKKHLEAIDGDSFGAGSLTGAGVTPNSIHLAASRVRSKHKSMEGIHDDVLKLQKQFEEDSKDEKLLIKKKVPGFVHYPYFSCSGIHIFLTDEALVRLYHVVCPHAPLSFDATGSLVRPIPWLRNHKNNPK